MKRTILTSVLGMVAALTFAQSDPVVMTVNGLPVTRSEFEYSYNKNNNDAVIDRKSVAEYAELYANYKMKVLAALEERLDTLSSFKSEFEYYRDQQVYPTLATDADLLVEARKAYDRVKGNIGDRGLIQPAHILLTLSSQASPQEQARVKQRADSIYDALKAGAKFDVLAKALSQDPRSAERGGVMGWLMPNQSYPEFEEVAFAMKTDEISRPFLAPDGYHIVQMKGKKDLEPFEELKGQILASFERQRLRETIAEFKLRKIVAADPNLTREQVIEQRADSMMAADPEMKYLIQEYHDGLLLYEISNRQVWDRAAKDEDGLRAWFKAHKKDYDWAEPHYKGIAYHVKDKADVKAVKNCVKRLPFDQWADALRTTFNPDSVIRIRVEKGLFKQGDNPTIDRLVFKVANAETQLAFPDYPIDAVYGKKLKKHPEDYTDVRAQVVNDYQEMLEQEWIDSLRRRYPVKINEDVLKTVNQH